ncbi:MAG: class I SAM-dependent methyltransferase [Proteobacteria bacterium]|nr:class I SAM-dependent methyltransferase [Pseudomonadota bacterium]
MKTSPDNEVRELYEDTANSYSKMMDSEIELPVYSDTLSRLAARIAELPGSVIDTSCGSGHMLELYHNRYDSNHSLIGVDLSPKMIEITAKRLGTKAKTFVGNMLDLSMVSSGSSVAVISFFAVHHLGPEEVKSALREWYRTLCNRGQLILAVWEGEGAIDYGDESELTALRYTREQVELWVTEAGFIIDRCKVDPVEEIPMDAIYLEASKPY